MNKKIIIFITIISIVLIVIGTVFLISNKEENKSDELAAIDLYTNLIDIYLKSGNHLNSNYDYISVNTSSFTDPLNNEQLSENAKKEILNYCKKYNDNIYGKVQNGSLTGLNIYFSIAKKARNKVTINVHYSISNSHSSGGRDYICTYNDGIWTINNGNNIWIS